MEQVGIRALKAALSEFVRRAAGGERILVTERGRPIAELGPHQAGGLPERLSDLVSRGEVSLASEPPTLPRVTVRLRGGASLSDVVIEERGSERLLR